MVNFNSFSSLLYYINTSGYILIFLILMLGGSAVTTVAAFAASLGYFNIFLIIFLSFFADLTEAILFYFIGFFGRRRLIGDYGNFFRMKVKALYKLEMHFQNHFVKTLFFVKTTPFLGIPGLTLAGVSHVSFKKYFLWNIIISFFKSIIFSIIGFFLGFVASSFLEGKPLPIYLFILFLIMFFLSWIGKHFMKKFLKKELSLGSIEIFSHRFYHFIINKISSLKFLKRKFSRFVNKLFN